MKTRPWLFYGWTLLAMSAVCMFIIYGLRYSFSVFYVAILNEFGWSRADTALIFSVNVIVYGLTAPIAGGLVDRFGPRVVLPLGALALGLGAIASSQANAIWQFMALYGVVMALGISAAGF
ncbi:MAG: MFS transporter, partial [Dehalococcoidia bacterium]|nr:MFS transporter [Dehalococcoidia bacterium]